MDPEIKKELEALHALVRDNHHLLRKVRRHQLIETWGHYLLWLLLLLVSYYAYAVYIAPLAAQFAASSGTSGSSLFGLPTSADLQKLLHSYKPAP